MTRHEKVSTVLSVVAILVSIASPLIGYYWLDPTLQSFKYRGRLQVLPTSTSIEITNVGELPAKDIQIVVQHLNGKVPSISFNPPIQYEAVERDTQSYINLKRALAAKDMLQIKFDGTPDYIAISNEFGETSLIRFETDKYQETQDALMEAIDRLKKEAETQKPNKSLKRTRR